MDLNQYLQIGLVLIVLIAILIGVIQLIKKRAASITSKEDLIEYLLGILNDKVVPYIMEQAMKEDNLNECVDYASFKNKFIDKFVKELYGIITNDKVEDAIPIPDKLKPFVTVDNLRLIAERAFELKEVDDFVYDVYMKLIEKRISEIESEEKKTVEYNEDVGVKDDLALEKEDLGIGKPKENNNMVSIESELSDAIDERDLVTEQVDD